MTKVAFQMYSTIFVSELYRNAWGGGGVGGGGDPGGAGRKGWLGGGVTLRSCAGVPGGGTSAQLLN